MGSNKKPKSADDQLEPYRDLLEQLVMQPDQVARKDRLQAVVGLEGLLRDQPGSTVQKLAAAVFARLLETGSSWDVRKRVAQALATLPDPFFEELAHRLHEDDNAMVVEAARQAVGRRGEFRRTERSKRRVGGDVLAQYDVLREQHGTAAADAALQMAEMHAAQLIADLIHHFNSILTSLQDSSLAAAKQAFAPDDRRHERISRGFDLIHLTLEAMRRYSEPLDPQRTLIRLLDIVKEAADTARSRAVQLEIDVGRITLEYDISPAIHLHLCEPLIVHALTNIIKNAYESFYEDGVTNPGEIRFVAAGGAEEVQLRITDTGIGLAPEQLAELRKFEPKRANKRKPESTGFGLPIARRYLAIQGGTLEIESTMDVGTTVTVALPANHED